MLRLTKDVIIEIANNLSITDAVNWSLTSRYFLDSIWNNQEFWYVKCRGHGHTGSANWKQTYFDRNRVYLLGIDFFGNSGNVHKRPTLVPDIVAKYVASGSHKSAVIDIYDRLYIDGNENHIKRKLLAVGYIQTASMDFNDTLHIVGTRATNHFDGVSAKSLACGMTHVVLINQDDAVLTMGGNTSGQLGINCYGDYSATLNDTGLQARQIACGSHHTMVIDLQGRLWAFGLNASGQLATGDLIMSNSPRLIDGVVATRVSCGDSFSAIINDRGELYVVGNNDGGQLGLGHKNSVVKLTRVPTVAPVREVACGLHHMAIIDVNYDVYITGSINKKNSLTKIDKFKATSVACGLNSCIFIGWEEVAKIMM